MKTKFFFLTIALIISLVIFSSCERKSGRRVSETQRTERVAKSDTIVFSPEKIGVTNLVKEFIPYPKFDGGTGIRVSFFIGIQYKEKTYQVECSDVRFFREDLTQEKAESDQGVSKLILAHYLAANTPKDYVDVMVINGEVVKLSRRAAFFADDTFYPTEVIWEKK